MKTSRILRAALFSGLIALIVGAGLGIDPSPALSLEPIKVGLSHETMWWSVPWYVGIDKGFFKEEGYDVEITSFRGGGDTVRAVTTKSVHLGGNMGGNGGMVAYAKGSPIRFVAGQLRVYGELNWIVMKDSPIRSIADVKAKAMKEGIKIALTSPMSTTDVLVRYILERENIPIGKVKLVSIGGASAQFTAIKTGQVDVVPMWNPVLAKVKDATHTVFTVMDYMPDFPRLAVGAHTDMIRDNPELLRKMIKGWKKAIGYTRSAKKGELVDIYYNHVKATPKDLLIKVAEDSPNDYFDYKYNWKGMENVMNACLTAGLIKASIDLKEFCVTRFIED